MRITPSSFISDGKYSGQSHRLLTIIRVLLVNFEPMPFFMRKNLPSLKAHKRKLVNANINPIEK